MIRLHVPLAELNGVSPQTYLSDDRFESLTTGSPTELFVLHIGADAPFGGAGNNLIGLKLSMHCEFFDPVQIGQS